MKEVKGNVDASVYVECPHCGYEFDAMEYDGDDKTLGNSLFGNATQPAQWDDVKHEAECPECLEHFIVTELEM